jgi:large subunit ribosomal protein L6
MSRVANQPVKVPTGVNVEVAKQAVSVKGPKGTLKREVHNQVKVSVANGEVKFEALDGSNYARMQAGTARALVNNMVQGVSKGFEVKLTLVGVGFRAKVTGSNINLTLGFSHPVDYKLPQGVTAETPSQTEIIIKGADKQLVGQVAADVRAFRSPEPYKGKGVRYADEVIVLKEAKKK